MRKNVLRGKVNFYISVCFLGSFTLFMMVTIFRVADMPNPVADVIAVALVEADN
jgi:hypothetical protein